MTSEMWRVLSNAVLWLSIALIQTRCKSTTLPLWEQKDHLLLCGCELSLMPFTDFRFWCSSYGTRRDFMTVVQHCRQWYLAVSSSKLLDFTWKMCPGFCWKLFPHFQFSDDYKSLVFPDCLLIAILCPFALVPMSYFNLEALLSDGELDAPFL